MRVILRIIACTWKKKLNSSEKRKGTQINIHFAIFLNGMLIKMAMV